MLPFASPAVGFWGPPQLRVMLRIERRPIPLYGQRRPAIAVASAPGRPVSESGRLCYGDGAHGRGGRRRMLLMSPSLLGVGVDDDHPAVTLDDRRVGVDRVSGGGDRDVDAVGHRLDVEPRVSAAPSLVTATVYRVISSLPGAGAGDALGEP